MEFHALRTSFKVRTGISRPFAFLNPDFDTLHSYPLPSPGLSSSDRLPFGIEENGGTPFTTKASGRHHHHHHHQHQHQHQHHPNYGLSLTLENKEGPLRSPNSSTKSLTSEWSSGAQGGWGEGSYRAWQASVSSRDGHFCAARTVGNDSTGFPGLGRSRQEP